MRHISNRKPIIVSVYIDDLLLALNCLNTLNILKKALGQKYNIKGLRKVQSIIG